MENLHEYVIWAIVAILLLFQLISFFNTKNDIKGLKYFFPNDFNIEGPPISVNTPDHTNKEIKKETIVNIQNPENPDDPYDLIPEIITDTYDPEKTVNFRIMEDEDISIESDEILTYNQVSVIHPITKERKEIDGKKASWYIRRGWDKV
jgi:hypothetical protein